jgi:hypothetical protein
MPKQKLQCLLFLFDCAQVWLKGKQKIPLTPFGKILQNIFVPMLKTFSLSGQNKQVLYPGNV